MAFGGASASAAATAARAASGTLGPRLDHRQRDPLPFVIDTHYPGRHHVADAHHVVRALDVAVGELADVDQARVLQPDVHEGAEVHDVQDGPLQLHAGG